MFSNHLAVCVFHNLPPTFFKGRPTYHMQMYSVVIAPLPPKSLATWLNLHSLIKSLNLHLGCLWRQLSIPKPQLGTKVLQYKSDFLFLNLEKPASLGGFLKKRIDQYLWYSFTFNLISLAPIFNFFIYGEWELINVM